MKKPILCLDFDGVCHSYKSGWKGAAVIPDEPVSGLFEFLEEAVRHFDVQVFSSRSHQVGGVAAMQEWFWREHRLWCLDERESFRELPLSFPKEKPPAAVSLDDRGVLFTGTFPKVEELMEFQPWWWPREKDVS